MGDSDRIDLELPVRRESVTEARHVVERFAGALAPDAHESLRLLVSELVGNSVRHAGLDADARIGLTIERSPERVRAEVRDSGPGFDPVPRPSLERASGFGLHLVETLADRWGVERGPGTRVWFEIRCAREATGQRATDSVSKR